MFGCDECFWMDRDHDEDHDCEDCGLERCFECTDRDPVLCGECRKDREAEAKEDANG